MEIPELHYDINKIEQPILECTVYGFRPAIMGMRLAKDSLGSIDTVFGNEPNFINPKAPVLIPESPKFGEEDIELMTRLVGLGGSHRKFLRDIIVWMRLNLPRYAWTDLDTYKVGTVRLSQSSRFTLKTRPLNKSDFQDGLVLEQTLQVLNKLREIWVCKGKPAASRAAAMKTFKGLLPESYLQESIWQANYEVLLRLYMERQGHPLLEFRKMCSFIKDELPLMNRMICSLTDKGR